MIGFHEKKLGDVLTFQRGFDITKSEQSEGNVPIVSSSGISSYHSKAKVKGPGVVIGRKGTLGTVHFIKEDFWPHDTTLWVKDFKGNNPRYLSYFLPALKLENFDVGAANPTLNRNHVHGIKVLFPSELILQERIAAILSAYDELIENNRRRIALLEKLAEEIYREWFVRLRFPGHEKVKLVKGVPEGWTIEPLGGLVSEIIDYRGITPEKLGTQWSEEGITALSALNVKNGRLIKLDDTYKASDSLYERWMRKELQMHDILLTSEAPLGQVYMLMDSEKYILSQRLFALRANPARMEPCYLYHYLLGPIGQGQLAARATGSTVGGIRQQLLRQIEVIVPPSGLQEDYRKLVLPILDQIHVLTKSTSALTHTRDLLLPRLISGKLSVEHLDIQFPPGMGGADS